MIMIFPPFVTDFLLTVCVTLRSHYPSGLLPQAPILDEALVTVEADPRCDFVKGRCSRISIVQQS